MMFQNKIKKIVHKIKHQMNKKINKLKEVKKNIV